MTSGGTKSFAFILLTLNLLMYGIVAMITGRSINYGIEHTHRIVSIPAHLFPIYFPIGNMATGFFVIVSLIAGLVGVATSISGINNVIQWNVASVLSVLACKEIDIGWSDTNLRSMEVLTIVLSGTQLLYMVDRHRTSGGRV
uniref:Uncharacterized protein n=1 Tax=Nelumbo nucifera TaxID=4432 RepID=A0A822YRZ5_NELNU|nr:TPA_asm: hypothetical protein HUJ06_012397 [Nelumbo nucifera]